MKEKVTEIIILEDNILQYRGKEFIIPKSWEEVTKPFLFGFVSGIIGNIPTSELPQYILIYATGIELPQKLTKKDKSDFLDVVAKASDLLSFFLGEENNLKFGIIDNIIGLSTPEKNLANFTAIEFVNASNYLNMFSKTNSIDNLNKLCAVLLRASSKNIRLEYSESQFNYSLSKCKTLSPIIKVAIMKMYEGELIGLANRYPKLFDGGTSEDKFPYSFITSLAGEKFGRTKDVEKENIHVLMNYMQSQIIEQEKQK